METLTQAMLQRGRARRKRHFPTARPRPLIPSWSMAKNRLGQDFTLVPPRWLSGARMGCGTKGQPQSWGAGNGGPRGYLTVAGEGGKVGSVPVPCSLPRWGWICPIPQPTVCCRTWDVHFPPRSDERGEPLAGLCTPRDLGEGRDRPHHVVRHSRGTSTCATPRNAIETFPGLFPSTRIHGEVSGHSSPNPSARTPTTIPQPQAPPNPNPHPIFTPKQTQASSSADREGLQQQDLASRLFPGCTIWFPLIQSKQTAAGVGGAPGPPTLPAPHGHFCGCRVTAPGK